MNPNINIREERLSPEEYIDFLKEISIAAKLEK
jgi:hypothetical protein